MYPRITAIIITHNEQLHLDRCISSLKKVVDEIIVVDSYSSDRTEQIAKSHGVRFLQNTWVCHADQVNFAIGQVNERSEWVLRLDADEYFSQRLLQRFRRDLFGLDAGVEGVMLKRRIKFMSREMKFGGLGQNFILRVFRNGKGVCENRLMDEHLVVEGKVVKFSAPIIDENHQSISWMINKYQRYSNSEAIETLSSKYRFLDRPAQLNSKMVLSVRLKRFAKKSIFERIPAGLRPQLYFFYRYLVLFGFMDGRAGLLYHSLQGLCYRILVDAKVTEAQLRIDQNEECVADVLKDLFDFEIS